MWNIDFPAFPVTIDINHIKQCVQVGPIFHHNPWFNTFNQICRSWIATKFNILSWKRNLPQSTYRNSHWIGYVRNDDLNSNWLLRVENWVFRHKLNTFGTWDIIKRLVELLQENWRLRSCSEKWCTFFVRAPLIKSIYPMVCGGTCEITITVSSFLSEVKIVYCFCEWIFMLKG